MPTRASIDPDILLLTHRDDRFAAVAGTLARVWPELVLERVGSASLLARLALRGRVRLVLIDADAGAYDRIGVAHHLARWRPDLPVLALVDQRLHAAAPARLVWWHALEDELMHSLASPKGGADIAGEE